MCNASTLALVSGNLVKFYRCTYDEPAEIDTQDDKFNSIVSEHIRKQEKEIARLNTRLKKLSPVDEPKKEAKVTKAPKAEKAPKATKKATAKKA